MVKVHIQQYIFILF